LPAKIVNQFVEVPKQLIRTAHEAAVEDPQLLKTLMAQEVSTSLDLLAPGAPALEVLAGRPTPAGVHFHSIIGVAFGEGTDSSDGVVPYMSAHVDGVDSEITVPASHLYVHHHPRAVLEVWRILLEHLREVRGGEEVPTAPPAEVARRAEKAGQLASPGIVHRGLPFLP
jgi:hypothetical protein